MGNDPVFFERPVDTINMQEFPVLGLECAAYEPDHSFINQSLNIRVFDFPPGIAKIGLLAYQLVGVVFSPPFDQFGTPKNPSDIYRIAMYFGQRELPPPTFEIQNVKIAPHGKRAGSRCLRTPQRDHWFQRTEHAGGSIRMRGAIGPSGF